MSMSLTMRPGSLESHGFRKSIGCYYIALYSESVSNSCDLFLTQEIAEKLVATLQADIQDAAVTT